MKEYKGTLKNFNDKNLTKNTYKDLVKTFGQKLIRNADKNK